MVAECPIVLPSAAMSVLTIPNVPQSIMTRLAELAAGSHRTIEEEALSAIAAAFRPADADGGPCDFPRPLTGPTAEARSGGERLPAPLLIEETTPE